MEHSQLLGNSLILSGFVFKIFFPGEQSRAQSRTKLFTLQRQGSFVYAAQCPINLDVSSLLGAAVTIPAPSVLFMTLPPDSKSLLTCRHTLISILLNTQGITTQVSGVLYLLSSVLPGKYSVSKLQVPWFPWSLNLVPSTQGLHSVLPGFPLLALQMKTQSQQDTELIVCFLSLRNHCLLSDVQCVAKHFFIHFAHLMVVLGRRENSVLVIAS